MRRPQARRLARLRCSRRNAYGDRDGLFRSGDRARRSAREFVRCSSGSGGNSGSQATSLIIRASRCRDCGAGLVEGVRPRNRRGLVLGAFMGATGYSG